MCNEVDYSDSYYYSDSDYYSDASDIEDDNNEFVKLEDILNNSTDDERYEPLRDYETKYEILYFAPHTIRNIKTHTPISTRILPSRYVQVCLSGTNQLLHRIVAKHFNYDYHVMLHPDATDFSKLDVHHKDHNRLNNSRHNLAICTRSENLSDRVMKPYGSRIYVDNLPDDAIPITKYKPDKTTTYIYDVDKYYYSPSTEQVYSRQEKIQKYQILSQNTCNGTTLRVNLIPNNITNKPVNMRKLRQQLLNPTTI